MAIFKKTITALQGVFDGANRVYSDSNPPETLLHTEFATTPSTPASGKYVEWSADGKTIWVMDDSGVKRMFGPVMVCRDFSVKGALAISTGIEVPMPPGTWMIDAISGRLTTASTAVVVDINKNGTTIFSGATKFGTTTNSKNFNAPGAITAGADSFIGGTDVLSVDIDTPGGATSIDILFCFMRTA